MSRILLLVVICAFLAGCVTPKYDSYIKHRQAKKLPENARLIVQISPADKIDIRGTFDSNNSLNTGSPLYSADAGAVGVVAQIFAQAAIIQSVRESKRQAQQDKANKVLQPFSKLLSNLTVQTIKHTSDLYSFDSLNTGKRAWIITSHPIFYLSQNSRQLSIKHLVSVRSIANPEANPVFSNRVEVFGPAIPADSAIETLRSDSKYGLQQQIKMLYRQSLNLAVKDLFGALSRKSSRYQTFKISNGSKIQFERGKLLSQTCDLKVIRNLRGWIIAFSPQFVSSACKPANTTESVSFKSPSNNIVEQGL